MESPACLDPLLDDGIFRPKGATPMPRALDVDLEQGLAFMFDLKIVLAQANPEVEMADTLAETFLIAV